MPKRFFILLLIFFISINAALTKDNDTIVEKKHSPKRATIYSAILPGLGQGYNKKYWKIPIIYVGIGTIYYFADFNGNEYKTYKKAYDYKTGTITDVNDKIKDIANRYTPDNLINLRDYYRRNMELSWIIMAVWYGLNIIDASVDAHFFEYDISDDLSLKVEPVLQPAFTGYAYGYGYGQTGISLKLKF